MKILGTRFGSKQHDPKERYGESQGPMIAKMRNGD